MFFFGSFVFFVSCLRFLSPLILCWFAVIMVVRDWFAWSVAAMVGSACAAFVRSFVCLFCLFIYLYTLQIYTKTYMYTYIW